MCMIRHASGILGWSCQGVPVTFNFQVRIFGYHPHPAIIECPSVNLELRQLCTIKLYLDYEMMLMLILLVISFSVWLDRCAICCSVILLLHQTLVGFFPIM